MDVSRARWSDLPKELWTVIFKRLETYIDVLRCRGVCRSWRASLPPLNAVSPLLPLQAPWPPGVEDADGPIEDDGILLRNIIYRISPLDPHQTPNSDSSSSSSPAKGWFSMVERRRTGKLLLRRPLFFSYLRYNYKYLMKEVNLLDFRIHEVAKSYTLVSSKGFSISGIRNVVMLPDSPWIDPKNSTLLAIYKDGKLGFAKLGDKDSKWTKIGKIHFHGGDVVACKGQFYAVNRRGVVFWIDSSTMKLTKLSTPLCVSGVRKHLVECEDKVYVVDQFDRESMHDFKVYNVDLDLDLELDAKVGGLKEVDNLGNKAFVLGDRGCFSILGTDFEGVQTNCIYYPRNFSGMLSGTVCVFDLEESVVKCHEDDDIFRPPPMLFDLNVDANRYDSYIHTTNLHY